MPSPSAWPYRAHRFLARHHLYPLALSSLLPAVLYAGRVHFSHSPHYLFLIWNLLLAWVPYGCSLWAVWLYRFDSRRWWGLLFPAALWLLYFPNAPYLVTDLLHLRAWPPIPLWYDVGMLVSFAWAGCALAIVSLSIMQSLVRAYLGNFASWLFVLASAGLSGLGVYMGRFLRWNSWDLLTQPASVLADIGRRLIHPLRYPQTYAFTVMFSALLLVAFLTFTAMQQRERV
ncbi:MAG: DUF1361 domain-containing protein [Chloroflexi bacterium]|nr:DUF1361 domain-containing protein [Chloroflexota bacterium]